MNNYNIDKLILFGVLKINNMYKLDNKYINFKNNGEIILDIPLYGWNSNILNRNIIIDNINISYDIENKNNILFKINNFTTTNNTNIINIKNNTKNLYLKINNISKINNFSININYDIESNIYFLSNNINYIYFNKYDLFSNICFKSYNNNKILLTNNLFISNSNTKNILEFDINKLLLNYNNYNNIYLVVNISINFILDINKNLKDNINNYIKLLYSNDYINYNNINNENINVMINNNKYQLTYKLNSKNILLELDNNIYLFDIYIICSDEDITNNIKNKYIVNNLIYKPINYNRDIYSLYKCIFNNINKFFITNYLNNYKTFKNNYLIKSLDKNIITNIISNTFILINIKEDIIYIELKFYIDNDNLNYLNQENINLYSINEQNAVYNYFKLNYDNNTDNFNKINIEDLCIKFLLYNNIDNTLFNNNIELEDYCIKQKDNKLFILNCKFNKKDITNPNFYFAIIGKFNYIILEELHIYQINSVVDSNTDSNNNIDEPIMGDIYIKNRNIILENGSLINTNNSNNFNNPNDILIKNRNIILENGNLITQ